MTKHDDLKREMPSKCKEEWDKDPELRKEFITLENYTAFRIAEESGSARVIPDIKRHQKEKDAIPLKPDPNKPVKKAQGELAERCIAQWKSDPAIRHEFGTVDALFAYCAADAQGRIRILGNSEDTNPTERS